MCYISCYVFVLFCEFEKIICLESRDACREVSQTRSRERPAFAAMVPPGVAELFCELVGRPQKVLKFECAELAWQRAWNTLKARVLHEYEQLNE